MPYYDRNPSETSSKIALWILGIAAGVAGFYMLSGGAKPPTPKDYVEGQIMVELQPDIPETMAPQGLGLTPDKIIDKVRMGSQMFVLLSVPVGREDYYVNLARQYPSIYKSADVNRNMQLH